MMRIRLADASHLGLMLAALAIAYVAPFELLLLAYVVLGPAHYATEISWLHDRKYHLPHGAIALALVAVAVVATLIDDATWFGLVMWIAFVACALVVATTSAQRLLIATLALGLTLFMLSYGLAMAVLGILLPTLIHVSHFTLVFMALGACRAASLAQWTLVAAYLASIALILIVPPSAAKLAPALAEAARDYFGNVPPALSRLFRIPNLGFDNRIAGLLAFVYTYHYLNWFIKADVIRWADVSRGRLALVCAVSAASTALYFYDYAYGFTVLLALALAHILLEFPLNALALRELGASVSKPRSQRV